jgi:hypothetical protein
VLSLIENVHVQKVKDVKSAGASKKHKILFKKMAVVYLKAAGNNQSYTQLNLAP